VPFLGDLDAYLSRIGVTAPMSVAQVHRAHATSIPFENFDPYAGRPVALDLPSLEEKMVSRGRGGYCFEHNLLLLAALEALGADEVAPMLARVRAGGNGGSGPLNHLLLRVRAEGQPWLADVGFGGAGLLDPLPFAPGRESTQTGWRYRLVEDGSELVVQAWQDGAWADLYGFDPEPAPMVDVEVANWYTSTHPASPFVTGVFAGARRPDRCLSLFVNDTATLIQRTLEGSAAEEIALDDVPQLFRARLGLDCVHIGPDGRLGVGPGSDGTGPWVASG
jgi:N-hydroxyarylamine O-acetyltransferase